MRFWMGWIEMVLETLTLYSRDRMAGFVRPAAAYYLRFSHCRRGTFLCSRKEKYPKESAPGWRDNLLASRLALREVARRDVPVATRDSRASCPRPFGLPAARLRGSARHTGWKRTPVLRIEVGCSTPRSARRVPQLHRGHSSEPLSESSRVLGGRRVGERPVGRGTEGTASLCEAACAPGRISFGDFSLSVQRKVTCRGSATHKYASPEATQRSSGGLRQKTPNPPYINIDSCGSAARKHNAVTGRSIA